MDMNRAKWNKDHSVLRQLLAKPAEFPRALPLLLKHHAEVHSARLGAKWSVQEDALAPLSEEHLRSIPTRGMPALWAIWHITRIEDAMVNILLAGGAQVFDTGDWQRRIGVRVTDVGNDMPAAEMARLCRTADIRALMAYRLAVAKRSETVFHRLNPEMLLEPPAADRQRSLRAARIVRPKAAWLYDYWGGNPAWNLLLMPATRHPFVHWNEICRDTPKIRNADR